MKSFTDNETRTWTLTINVNAVKRVRSLVDVDLMRVLDGDLLERLVGDPVLLCDVIFALVRPEADSKNVTDEDFGRSMAGDAIDRATQALLEELVDFFPEGRRKVLAKALERFKVLESKALALAETRLDDPQLEQRIEACLRADTHRQAELASMPGSASGSAPASSGSIPGR